MLEAALAALAEGRSTQAEGLFREILARSPDHPSALQGLGKALLDQLRLDEAEFAFGEAVAVEELPARAQYHLGLCRLLRGDYQRGWAGWEKRFEVPGVGHPAVPLPRWTGEGSAGRRLLVIAEQGFGDTVQFSRFLPALVARTASAVTFACPAPVLPLYRGLARDHGFAVTEAVRAERFDSFVAICSLAAIGGIDIADLPGELPALTVDEDKVARWREARPQARVVAGLCWEGRPTHPQDNARSVSPDHLLPLKDISGLELVGLQRPPWRRHPPAGLLAADWGPGVQDFSDLAAMVLALDFVITADTALAHLAGTLNRPAFVMLPFLPDWRWLLGRADSPWYPSVRLVRQQGPGDWAAPVDLLCDAIRGPGPA